MNQRLKRLADQIQRTLATLIRDEINDPRLTGMVTISNVKVSSDLGYADVYVTILGGDGLLAKNEAATDFAPNELKSAHQESLEVLNKAAGFLRTELSRTLSTRITPRLRFHYDEVVLQGNHMMALVSEAMARTERSHTVPENADNGENADGSV